MNVDLTHLTFSIKSKLVDLSKVYEVDFAGYLYEDTEKKWHKPIQIKGAPLIGITHKTLPIVTLSDTKTDSDYKR